MSIRVRGDAGAEWIQREEKIPPRFARQGRWWSCEVRKLNPARECASDIVAAGFNPSSLIVDLEREASRISLRGIDQLTHVEQLRLHGDARIMDAPEDPLPALSDLMMTFEPTSTPKLCQTSSLRFLELHQPPQETRGLVSPGLRSISLYFGKTIELSGWPVQMDSIEIERCGKLIVTEELEARPSEMSLTSISVVTGLPRTSRLSPFNLLYLSGIRSLGTQESLWDIEAERTVVEFARQPPKWLLEQWPHRPKDWANHVRVPPHRALEGSFEQDYPEDDPSEPQ